MADIKNNFQLVFPENQKKDTNLPTTEALAFDDLGDFIEERERVKREAQRLLDTDLRVDYSDFANHVFFDSALSKLNIAKSRILNQYPFNGSREEKDAFHLTGSGYEGYVFEQWPRDVSYAVFNGTSQYISTSDTDNKLLIGTSSFYASAWIDPFVDTTSRIVCSHLSQSGADFWGFIIFVHDDSPVMVGAKIYSGSNLIDLSFDGYGDYTGSFHNVAVSYDVSEGSASLYVNERRVAESEIANDITGPIEFKPSVFIVGSGTLAGTAMYSGSIDEVRFALTASHLWHVKNYSRPIDAEEYVKLRYSFNEGFIGTSSIDKTIVDYSKSGLHGTYLDYSTDTSRVSGSTMLSDPGDPILYSFHSRVVDFTGTLDFSASLYDNNNNNQITNMIPEVLLTEDDNADGLYLAFMMAMARFFDEVKLSIDQFDNLRITNYAGVNDTPDLFLPMVQRYFGWKVTEHFGDANPLALFFGENVLSSGSLEMPLIEVKNQFWRRILNNLPYLLKTKGKRHNLDAFFNVLGINKENITLKEYGYLPGTSIQDTRIHKEKVASLLGIGTGSFGVLSSSFVKATGSISSALSSYTVETYAQLPFVSASYSGTLTTGSIWQFVDPEQVTGSFSLLWNVPSLGSSTGKFVLTGSDGQEFSSSLHEVFDGDFVHIAAGLDSNQLPFIEVRTIDNDEVDFSASDAGSVALSGIFTGSKFDFVMGANSGSVFAHETQGFYGEYRIWNRNLSGSEMDDHALHFESVGISNPNEEPHPLLTHWALNENLTADADGVIGPVPDLSRNGIVANGAEFPAGENPYQKFLLEYNYLSPSIDLKWTDNKVRIRNKTELTIDDVATDTNEVSLEFNLVESLNEDITKIFSTFEILNDLIGKPVNKYRDEYSDLESVRREYFERMGDSVHFTNFFKLFKWFDRKLSDSIKQLLPARVRFVGGEQVVESHLLERSKYGYKYPMFRTPQDVPEMTLRGTAAESVRDADPLRFQDEYLSNSAMRIQSGTADSGGNLIALTATFSTTPTNGNTLIAVFGLQNAGTSVASIDQSGASWNLILTSSAVANGTISEMWVAEDVSDAESEVRIAYSGVPRSMVTIIEYSGLDGIDTSASFDYDAGVVGSGDTGTTPASSQEFGYFVAGVAAIPNTVITNDTPAFSEVSHESSGILTLGVYDYQQNAFTAGEKAEFSFSPNSVYGALIVGFKASSSSSLGLVSDRGDSVVVTEGDKMKTLPSSPPESFLTANSQEQRENAEFYFNDRNTQNYLTASSEIPGSLVTLEAAKIVGTPLSVFRDGVNEKRINPDGFTPHMTFTKTSGDSAIDENDPNSGVNFRNEYAREVVMKKDRDNES